jgi:hypothetical protein
MNNGQSGMKAGRISSARTIDVAKNHGGSRLWAHGKPASGKSGASARFGTLQIDENRIHSLPATRRMNCTSCAIRKGIEMRPVFLSLAITQDLQALSIGDRPCR